MKYTLIIVVSMLLIAVVISATMYWDLSQVFFIKRLSEPVDWEKYFIRVILLLCAVFISGIFFSHKIIGPLSRLEDMLRDMNRGKFKGRIKLRDGDDFKDLGDELNTLSDKLEAISEKYPEVSEKFQK
ncbi:MAG: hypothetical protein ABIH89_06825 [Elusimicrobiota bacterium]